MIETLRKLINHERSARSIGNIPEAEAFAAKIQKLLFDHRLTMSEVEVEEEAVSQPVGQESLDVPTGTWAGILAVAAGKSAFCRVLKSGQKLIFIGSPTNRESAIAMFRYLFTLGQSLATSETARWKKTEDYTYRSSFRPGVARTWKNSFLQGYAGALYHRLEGERKTLTAQAQAAGNALVYVGSQERAVSSYVVEKYGKLRKGSSSRTVGDSGAYRAGYQHGSSVSTSSRAALPA